MDWVTLTYLVIDYFFLTYLILLNPQALEGYAEVREPNFRVGGSYDESRFIDERYPRDGTYQRNNFHRDILDGESYLPPGSAAGHWSQSKRRGYDEDYPLDKESRRFQRPYHESYNQVNAFRDREIETYPPYDKFRDGYGSIDNYGDQAYDKPDRFAGPDRNDYEYDDHGYKSRLSHHRREDSHERDYNHGRHSYDSDYEGGSRRDNNRRRHESRDRERGSRDISRERDLSPRRRHERSRSRSRSQSNSRSRSLSRSHSQSRGYDYEDHPRSKSPRGRSHSRSYREDSYVDSRYDRSERRRDREDKHQREHYSVAPSPTVVVKGLSQKTTEEDLYQILAESGPLRHVRIIRERNSGISRGFAFIDFPSVGAAQGMMEKLGDDGLVVDGRKLFFEYSKPTGGPGPDGAIKSGHNHKMITVPSDWMCTICGYINFARRSSCYQCNEPRTEDAPAADISSSNSTFLGRKGLEAGPTHVLVVRGLDENADEEMLRYEFSKHAPIKDLRLVRDKFTHVSRGFAFVHFHSVEDATKALGATNGTTLEKNGQILRVAYAKSILGPGSGASSQSSSLAAAAIEAATFAQQYDTVGWAPKEYNPDDKQFAGPEQTGTEVGAPQSGFVWDEASGYYYDAASGFYYDGNTGLYYDGNNGIWYSYDNQTQQYMPCTDQNQNKTDNNLSEPSKASDGSSSKKVVISAPVITVASVEKPASLADAVQAAAAAAFAAEKKEKEKLKEIKLASKSSILANKKKMNNVLTMWKQRSHEGQTTRVALEDNQLSISADDKHSSGHSVKNKLKSETLARESNASTMGVHRSVNQAIALDPQPQPRPVSNSLGGSVMGVIRGSGRGVVKSDTSYSGSAAATSSMSSSFSANVDAQTISTPFKTDVSALSSHTPSVASVSGRRRFSEMPYSASNNKEQFQTTYRDRAAERRSLYGSSSSVGNDLADLEIGDSNREFASRKGDPMPFPPGVGGGRVVGDVNLDTYEVITADKAIDESNVGNRMLRNMGWQEGLGLGKDGSGMVEPVQALGMENRAGLGSQHKNLDPSLEVQAGDSYKMLIHKKALARFRDM
ncbi:PREDICTED: SUPPRESSOR OF ABI3-5-like isoform X1 [Lupinus angustifolius]|uniref:SUPPRESSOR OF ABI3-5-like isoform X1 n=1 Tax=Lupinus angustifolius TaxID=3871 RepID=UPI00092E7CD5|nr:PREDICTED: SUPPRESSOR OF ABI3-5-like isoform X1 [Lupinus angustifolius]